MAADSSIYSLLRPAVAQADPIARAGQAMQLKTLMGQNDTQEIQRQQLQKGIADEADIEAAWVEGKGDLPTVRDLLAGKGKHKAVMAIDKTIREGKKEDAAIGRDNAAAGASTAQQIERTLNNYRSQLTQINDPNSAAQWLSAQYQDPVLGPLMARMTPLEEGLQRIPQDPQAFQQWRQQVGMGMEKFAEHQRGLATLAHTQANAPFTANPTPGGAPVPNLPVQAFKKEVAKSGATTINTGNQLPLGKPAMGKVDEGLLDTSSRLMRLSQIESGYKPEFQQVGTRLSNTWSAIKEKGGANLNTADRAALDEFSRFKRNSIDSLNQYIKEITGAAMSEAEAQRILRGMPNPGTGVFDGDSPTEFNAKLKDAIVQARMAEARLVHIKRTGGMNIADIPLDRMPSLINARGKELETSVKGGNPGASPADVSRIVKRQLAQEFGLISE